METGEVKSKSPDTDEQPPIRSVFSLKNKKRTREIENIEECFILDFNPYESLKRPFSPSQFVDQENDAPDITVIAEHGKVYIHYRHYLDCIFFFLTSEELTLIKLELHPRG